MSRLEVRKTHKLYIDGEFPRSESGRVIAATDHTGEVVARVAHASRKDLRDAVRAARNAQSAWARRTGYNRGQIIYRVAELVEERRDVFARLLAVDGRSASDADGEVSDTVDRLVWYAGWADKFAQVAGNLNPVAGPYFNISAPEATGVVGVIAPETPPLLGLVSALAPVLVSGNTTVTVASGRWPLAAVSLAEVLVASDVPAGVVNLLTGDAAELMPFLADHMDVDALDISGLDAALHADAVVRSAGNVKRVHTALPDRSPHRIAAFTETKTVWHPKGR